MSDVAIEAVAAAVPAGEGPLEVVGDTAFARDLRARLGAGPIAAGARPAVIVEASGEASALAAALGRVADLGTVVLAGPRASTPVDLDLYADLHVRGLTVVGVAPAAGGG